jgi:hypothetical protein
MTFKEKLKQEHPEIADKYFGCPNHLDYETENIHCEKMDCFECWNREMPGTEVSTTKFICSECGIHLIEFFGKIYFKGGNYHYEEIFKCSYCPNCGNEVK